MNVRELMPLISACPFGCGWEANRKIKPGVFTTEESLFPQFIARCREDIAEHMVLMHGADRQPLDEKIADLFEARLSRLEDLVTPKGEAA